MWMGKLLIDIAMPSDCLQFFPFPSSINDGTSCICHKFRKRLILDQHRLIKYRKSETWKRILQQTWWLDECHIYMLSPASPRTILMAAHLFMSEKCPCTRALWHPTGHFIGREYSVTCQNYKLYYYRSIWTLCEGAKASHTQKSIHAME